MQAIFSWLESFDDLRPSLYQSINLQSVKYINGDLYQQLSNYEALLYRGNKSGSDFDFQSLLRTLKQFRQEKLKALENEASGPQQMLKKRRLEPFYQ